MSNDTTLYALIRDRHAERFAWGTHDCAMLAFDAVQTLTGRDPAADLRGTYSNAMGALRTLAMLGGLEALCAARFGAPVPIDEAEDGDIALLRPSVCAGESCEHGALGVFWRGLVVAQGDMGLMYLQRDRAQRAWRAA